MELNHETSCLPWRRCDAYSLGKIKVGEHATAQEAYLCTGTHDFKDPWMQLITEK